MMSISNWDAEEDQVGKKDIINRVPEGVIIKTKKSKE